MTDHPQDSNGENRQVPSAGNTDANAASPQAGSASGVDSTAGHQGYGNVPPAPPLPNSSAQQSSDSSGQASGHGSSDQAPAAEDRPSAAAAHDFRTNSGGHQPSHQDTAATDVYPPAGYGAAFGASQAPTANYGSNGYQGSAQYGGQHHQPYGTPSDGSAAYGPTGYAPNTHPQPAERREKRRSNIGLLVAGLAVGALVGGAAGAGTSALITTNQSSTVSSNAVGSENVTINDPADVTRASAIAAKASPSVVTLSVQGGQSAGSGSGVILSKDGYVLTNNHVVTLDGQLSDPDIQVTSNDGKLYTGTVVGTDPVYDLAVIKLEGATDLTPMEFADSSKLNVGDVAVAIGAPLGLAGTVTDGIVSALNRSITVASSAVPEDSSQEDNTQKDPYDVWGFDIPGQTPNATPSQQAVISLSVIQTDAAINPGNSGGALVDDQGELIGVNVAIASASSSDSSGQGGSIGVGFAITSNIAERVAKEIIENGEATHGLLGATVGDAASADNSPVVGALINEATPGGAAEKAGLTKGDIVTSFNGSPVTNATDLTAQVRALAAGADAKLTYVRNGDTKEATVTLGELVL
ncbi:putative serine protease PepD [Okibacterium sp. HSC-33S16]|uniref:S1C family serine protease n=1 Tax=Okibacterium sp. HSC-33S16 TaxID=2910965 RepID=UPI0020A032A9|nr:trypsin-like peptidase domain-containing protein [Okibacterium sp. HSC-33S16]MCP2030443.1 putative serine protease PepD [Okibacterium sp. HSC-33S16]